jgi:ParB-like chromosome segregation protein Spo0J
VDEMKQNWAVADIKTGRRVRKEYGDIDSLVASIDSVGLLQPIGIRPDGSLVCGGRRLRAFKKMKRDTIPVYVFRNLKDELDYLLAERDENTCREPLTPSEARTMADKLKPKFDAAAKQAMADGQKSGGGDRRSAKAKRSGGSSPRAKRDEKKRSAEQAAATAGISRRSLAKVREIEDAAKDDSRTYGEIAAKLKSRGCKIDAVFNEYKNAKKTKEDNAAAKKAKQHIDPSKDYGIHHGDSFELAATIPDGSCALIFTDPPYAKKDLCQYESLGYLADRILVKGGSLITYLGQYAIPEVIHAVTEECEMSFYWPLCCVHEGSGAQLRMRGLRVRWKPMLWFVKGTGRRNTQMFVDDLVYSKKEKAEHDWQQSSVEATYYIEKLTTRDELVVDPFCGGGTTAAVAKRLGRQWWTSDIDENCVIKSRKRIHAISK